MNQNKTFTPRLTQLGGFSIYSAPCAVCPPSIKPWIQQFCSLPENSWYVPIDKEWAGDLFNAYGLKQYIPNFDIALEMITDSHSDQWVNFNDQNIASILAQAKQLYGLLHARWITQPKGLALMKEKYECGTFGQCPRYCCKKQNLLPIGTTLKPKRHTAKLFCPRCVDIYVSQSLKIDGAHFGPAFPHVFLFEHSELNKESEFVPFRRTAFGFSVHKPQNYFEPHASNVRK